MIRTIIFDFGNVLAFFDHEQAIRQLLAHTDRSADDLRALIYRDNLASRYECGDVRTEQVFEVARQHGGIRCSIEEFVHAFCDIFTPNAAMGELVPHLKRQGYRLVLASNTNEAHFAYLSREYRTILENFDARSVSHEARARKPQARFYEYTHGMTNAAPQECVFIDDLPENIAAGQSFGWHGIQYQNPDLLRERLREFQVRV